MNAAQRLVGSGLFVLAFGLVATGCGTNEAAKQHEDEQKRVAANLENFDDLDFNVFTFNSRVFPGTATLPVWSGNVVRDRLSRGGNRQLNAAIHRIAITQLQRPGPGQTYLAHRRAAGDTQHEEIRALRRRISDEVYRRLRVDELAHQRQLAGPVAAA